MKARVVLATGLLGSVASSFAFAQGTTPAPTTAPTAVPSPNAPVAPTPPPAAPEKEAAVTAAPAPTAAESVLTVMPDVGADAVQETSTAAATKGRLGLQLEFLPIGSLGVVHEGDSVSEGAALAYGVGAVAAYDVTPYLTFGAAPRLVLNVKGKDAPSSAKEVDLRAQIVAHFPIVPKVEVYGVVTPGFSLLVISDNRGTDPSGFIVGLGAGATYDVAPNLFVSGELGYQFGFQAIRVKGENLGIGTSYLHVGAGVGLRL